MQPAAPQEWTAAPAVQEVANELINKFHSHLGPVKIQYFFFSKEIVTGDQVIWGRARKISGINAVLANNDGTDEHFFVIEIWRTIWDTMDLPHRRALVDHELEHCWVDDNGKLSLAKHDVEEFTNVIKRHGLWRSAVQDFVNAANGKGQGDLFDPIPAPEPTPEPEAEDGHQNVLTMPTPRRQLHAAPTNAISTGSTAMPGQENRQLGDGDDHHPTRCPGCEHYSQKPAAEINSWARGEIDLLCDNCGIKFPFTKVLPGADYTDAIDADFTEVIGEDADKDEQSAAA